MWPAFYQKPLIVQNDLIPCESTRSIAELNAPTKSDDIFPHRSGTATILTKEMNNMVRPKSNLLEQRLIQQLQSLSN